MLRAFLPAALALALAATTAARSQRIEAAPSAAPPTESLSMLVVQRGGQTGILGHVTGTPGSPAFLFAGASPASSAMTYFSAGTLDQSGQGMLELWVPTAIYRNLPLLELSFVAVTRDAQQRVRLSPYDSLMLGTLPCGELDFDFDANGDPLQAGEELLEQYAAAGLHISADNKTPGHPDKAILFDSSNPTGEDDDLVTPGPGPNNTVAQGLLMIVAEDDVDLDMDGLVDDPDDEAGGGVITFRFDDVATFCDITLVDLDDGGGSELRFYLGATLVDTVPLPSGPDNGVQTVSGLVEVFDRMEVDLVGSGAVASFGFYFCPARVNFDTYTAGLPTGLEAGEELTEQLAGLGMHVSALNNTLGHPDKAILFDTANVTGEDTDLVTPGYGVNNDEALGLVLIIAEDDVDMDVDGLVDDPDDERFGGVLRFEFDFEVEFVSAKLLDIDTNEAGALELYDGSNVLITSIPLMNLGDNSVQTVEAEVFGVRRIDVVLSGSGAIADLAFCPDFGVVK